MSESKKANIGTIGWIDLTVDNAGAVRDFYSAVVGWRSEGVSMGDYEDFNMIAPGNNEPVAGVCHARSGNTGLPAQWLMYITIENIEQSTAACKEKGGKVLREPKAISGYGTFCVIEDPAGAVVALFETE